MHPLNADAMDAFAPGVAEKIGYYVCLSIDPRDKQVFYVRGLGTIVLPM